MRRFPLVVLAAATLLTPACADDTWTPEPEGGGDEMAVGDGLRTDEQGFLLPPPTIEGQLLLSPYDDPRDRSDRVDDGFGTSIAIDGDLAVVGAPFTLSRAGVRRGAVYVFNRDARGEWYLLERIDPPRSGMRVLNPLPDGRYQIDLATTRGTPPRIAVTTVPYTGVTLRADDPGYAEPEDALDEGLFGWRVALDGNYLVVSAPRAIAPSPGWNRNVDPPEHGDTTGKGGRRFGLAFVYTFDRDNWTFLDEPGRAGSGFVGLPEVGDGATTIDDTYLGRPMRVIEPAPAVMLYPPSAGVVGYGEHNEPIDLGPVSVEQTCATQGTVRVGFGMGYRERLAGTMFEWTCERRGNSGPRMERTTRPAHNANANAIRRPGGINRVLDRAFDLDVSCHGITLGRVWSGEYDSSGRRVDAGSVVFASSAQLVVGDAGGSTETCATAPSTRGCIDRVDDTDVITRGTDGVVHDVSLHYLTHRRADSHAVAQVDIAVDRWADLACAELVPEIGILPAHDWCPDGAVLDLCYFGAGLVPCDQWRVSTAGNALEQGLRVVSAFGIDRDRGGDMPRTERGWVDARTPESMYVGFYRHRPGSGFGLAHMADERERRVGYYGWDVDTDGNSTIVADVLPILPVDNPNDGSSWGDARAEYGVPSFAPNAQSYTEAGVISEPGVPIAPHGQVFIYDGDDPARFFAADLSGDGTDYCKEALEF